MAPAAGDLGVDQRDHLVRADPGLDDPPELGAIGQPSLVQQAIQLLPRDHGRLVSRRGRGGRRRSRDRSGVAVDDATLRVHRPGRAVGGAGADGEPVGLAVHTGPHHRCLVVTDHQRADEADVAEHRGLPTGELAGGRQGGVEVGGTGQQPHAGDHVVVDPRQRGHADPDLPLRGRGIGALARQGPPLGVGAQLAIDPLVDHPEVDALERMRWKGLLENRSQQAAGRGLGRDRTHAVEAGQ